MDLRCPNAESCPAQVRGRVEHIGSRGGLDIEALGEVTAAALTQPDVPETPPLRTEADLFDLVGYGPDAPDEERARVREASLARLGEIEVVVRDPETGLPREDEDGNVRAAHAVPPPADVDQGAAGARRPTRGATCRTGSRRRRRARSSTSSTWPRARSCGA